MSTAPSTMSMPRALTDVTKQEVLSHYGGSTTQAARAMMISPSAVSMWPDKGPLPATMRDRFQAALWRESVSARKPARHRPVAAILDAVPAA